MRFLQPDLSSRDNVVNINFSFTPGFSLGFSGRTNDSNRFNGFTGRKTRYELERKPLKRLCFIKCFNPPRLKPVENEN